VDNHVRTSSTKSRAAAKMSETFPPRRRRVSTRPGAFCQSRWRCAGMRPRARESFSANDQPHGNRLTRKRLPTPGSVDSTKNYLAGCLLAFLTRPSHSRCDDKAGVKRGGIDRHLRFGRRNRTGLRDLRSAVSAGSETRAEQVSEIPTHMNDVVAASQDAAGREQGERCLFWGEFA
jgi:hypothetical protein